MRGAIPPLPNAPSWRGAPPIYDYASPSGFPTNILRTFCIIPMRSTCPAYLIILHLAILKLLG